MSNQPKDLEDFKAMLRQIYKEQGGCLIFSFSGDINEKDVLDSFCNINIGKRFKLGERVTVKEWDAQFKRMVELRPGLMAPASNPSKSHIGHLFSFYKGRVIKAGE